MWTASSGQSPRSVQTGIGSTVFRHGWKYPSCTSPWVLVGTCRLSRSITIWVDDWRWSICWRRASETSHILPDRWIGGKPVSEWRPGGTRCRTPVWPRATIAGLEGDWSSESGEAAAKQLFQHYPEMDAIFVANDQMALSVLHVAPQHGRSVPQDLGIVGFDNIPESEYFRPALTSVQQDQYKVGKVAVEEITRIIESRWQGLGANRAQVHHVVSHAHREAEFGTPCE